MGSGMGMRKAVVLTLGLGVWGCDADVDSPFTGVSAGGTSMSGAAGSGSTGPQPSTGSSSEGEGSTSSTTTGAEPTPGTSSTAGANACDPNPCVDPEVCVDGVCQGMGAPGAGEVVITELQPNPDAVTDEAGEWFEVQNLAAVALDLDGCELSDQGSDAHTIAGAVVIEAGAYAVLGRAAAANGGVPLDYAYGADVSLGNDGDELTLRCAGVVVDEVIYTGTWPFGTGAAAQLDPGAGALNDDASGWCEATTPYGDGDLGTPGAANPPC